MERENRVFHSFIPPSFTCDYTDTFFAYLQKIIFYSTELVILSNGMYYCSYSLLWYKAGGFAGALKTWWQEYKKMLFILAPLTNLALENLLMFFILYTVAGTPLKSRGKNNVTVSRVFLPTLFKLNNSRGKTNSTLGMDCSPLVIWLHFLLV